MFDAQLLRTPLTVVVFSPWFPRGGDNARFPLDLVEFDATGAASMELSVRAFTKNTEDSGDGADADTSTKITAIATGRTTVEWASTSIVGFKELVRYQFTLANVSDEGGEVWSLFRMLPPVWFDDVKGA